MGYKMDICQVAALRIRKMRLEKNMTIDDLAEKCDVSTQTIKLIEAGRRNFKIKTLYTIANSLNVSSDYLIGRFNWPYRYSSSRKYSSREFDIRVNNRGSDLSGFNTVKVCGNFKEGRD